jgi:hypothetical protein
VIVVAAPVNTRVNIKINSNYMKTTTPHKKVRTNNTAQHHGTITHLVLDLLHRLELFYRKQQTSRRNEMKDIE